MFRCFAIRFFAVPFVIFVAFLSGCDSQSDLPKTVVRGSVRLYQAGPRLGTVGVTFEAENGERVRSQTLTNGQFEVALLPRTYTVSVSEDASDAYATSQYEDIEVSGTDMTLSLVTLPRFNARFSADAPEVVLETRGSGRELEVRVQTESDLPIRDILVGLGREPTSRIVSPAETFALDADDTSKDTDWFSLPEEMVMPYSGTVTLYAIVYDRNYNRTQVTTAVSLPETDSDVVVPAPEVESARVVTTNSPIRILSSDPLALDPLAPVVGEPATVIAQVRWLPLPWSDALEAAAAGNYGFKIYRQKNGSDWREVGRAAPDAVDWTDADVDLTDTVRYAVRAFVGDSDSALSESNAVTPLPPFEVTWLEPAPQATDVSRTPTLRWESNLPEGATGVYRVRVNDDIVSVGFYDSPTLINETAWTWDEERFSSAPQLAPLHPYSAEITLAYAMNTDSIETATALSVAVDTFAVVIGDTTFPGMIYPFETGTQ